MQGTRITIHALFTGGGGVGVQYKIFLSETYQISDIFIHENAFEENVIKMGAILFRI